MMSHLNVCASRETEAKVACDQEHILATVTTDAAAFASNGDVPQARFNSASEKPVKAVMMIALTCLSTREHLVVLATHQTAKNSHYHLLMVAV